MKMKSLLKITKAIRKWKAYPKGFALCHQPLLDAQDQSERVDLEILRILPQEMARDLDSGAQICSATFWRKSLVPERCQSDPKVTPKWSQSDLKVIPRWPQDDPKMTPKWFQDDPRFTSTWLQNDAILDDGWWVMDHGWWLMPDGWWVMDDG